ncbi:MAG: proteasome subunit alpha [Thermoproteota archaeon]|nr:proteasome subunit alpha [Thermoproteota archaeon]
MSENASGGAIGFGNNSRFPSYYGPEGRLVLVDSALEAVNRGSTTIGIKTPAFALLSSHIKPTKPLVEPAEKVFTIDEHIGATGSGYIGDILQLIDEIQLAAQKHRLTYESPIDVNSLAKHLSSYLHNYTIYAVRPQAASIIIAGADQTGVQMYQVDPSGTFFRGAGFAIGQYSDIALDVIQKEYSIEMDVEQAIQLSNKAIEKVLGERPMVQTGIITTKDGSFKRVVNN